MKKTILFVFLINPFFAYAEDVLSKTSCEEKQFFTNMEINYAANAAWKHYILKLLDDGKAEDAKRALLGIQSADIMFLDQLETEGKLSKKYIKSLQAIKNYNQSRHGQPQK